MKQTQAFAVEESKEEKEVRGFESFLVIVALQVERCH